MNPMIRVLVLAGGLAAVVMTPVAVASAPAAAACNGGLVTDANGTRCIDSGPGVSAGVPPVGVGVGPYGPEVYTGPWFPGNSWNIPLG